MHVLLVSHYALPHVGGIEFIVDRIARELVARGHTVTHLASDTRFNRQATAGDPYQRILVPAWQGPRERFLLPYPVFAPRKLWNALEPEVRRADIVHVHGMLYMNSALAFHLDKKLGRNRRVLTEHVGHIPYTNRLVDAAESIAIATIGRYTARRANVVITYNGRVAREMHRLAPTARLVHVPNGVDLGAYRPASPEERVKLRAALGWDAKPRVLFVGRFVEKKGIHLVLEAARRANGQFEVVLAGPGSVDSVPSNVENRGELKPEHVAELYRAADAFLLPSHGEGFPLAAQEAMASALPVILRNDGGYEVVVGTQKTGAVRFVEPDADAIVTAIRETLAEPGAGREAFELARTMTWAHAIDTYERLYDEVIRRDQ